MRIFSVEFSRLKKSYLLSHKIFRNKNSNFGRKSFNKLHQIALECLAKKLGFPPMKEKNWGEEGN